MNSYKVYVDNSDVWLVEIEVEAPNLKAIRKNWDDISHELFWEVLETALSGSQLPNPPDLEAELLPELEGLRRTYLLLPFTSLEVVNRSTTL